MTLVADAGYGIKTSSDMRHAWISFINAAARAPRVACHRGLLAKKAYGKLQAVDGISFSVDEGEVFSLLGPNGAGKTTTIEILEGLREKTPATSRCSGWTHGRTEMRSTSG